MAALGRENTAAMRLQPRGQRATGQPAKTEPVLTASGLAARPGPHHLGSLCGKYQPRQLFNISKP